MLSLLDTLYTEDEVKASIVCPSGKINDKFEASIVPMQLLDGLYFLHGCIFFYAPPRQIFTHFCCLHITPQIALEINLEKKTMLPANENPAIRSAETK